jgi:hypothetical protein
MFQPTNQNMSMPFGSQRLRSCREIAEAKRHGGFVWENHRSKTIEAMGDVPVSQVHQRLYPLVMSK